MTDFGNIKKKKPTKRRLEAPPSTEQAPDNVQAPETAPEAASVTKKSPKKKKVETVQFNTTVTKTWKTQFAIVAARDGKKHNRLLEEMLELYEQNKEN